MRLIRYINEAIKSKMIKGLYGKVRVIEGYKNHKRLYVHKKGKHGYMVTDTEKVSLDNMIKIGSEFWFGTLKELHAALNEQSVDITHELNLIKHDCQPFIRQAKPCKGLAVRSATALMSTNFIKKKTRKNRKPLSTPVNVHNMLDKLFVKRFGWKVRSEGVFTYGVEGFLYSHYAFPIGNFKFVYNPKVKDLYDYLIELKHDLRIGWNEIEPHDLSYIMNTYTNKNLCGAMTYDKPEIVFKCKEYYLLRTTTIHPDDLRDYLYK